MSILPDGTLRIIDTQRDDSGKYTCIASNTHGSDQVDYSLKILGKTQFIIELLDIFCEFVPNHLMKFENLIKNMRLFYKVQFFK